MSKEKVRLLIPLSAVAIMLIYCWLSFAFTEVGATWKHHLGISLYAAIIYCFFTNLKIATIATGVFLLLATFSLLAITPAVSTFALSIGPVTTPDIQLLSLGLFILYLTLNLDQLADIYLDYRGTKSNGTQ